MQEKIVKGMCSLSYKKIPLMRSRNCRVIPRAVRFSAATFICGALMFAGICQSADAEAKTVTKKVGKGKIQTKNGKISINKKTKKVSLKKSGTYTISGKISGYTLEAAAKKANIKITLNGATLTNTKTSCIYSKYKESKLTLQGKKGKKNSISGAKSYPVPKNQKEPEPDAAVYSEGDITFAGQGSITVNDASSNGEAIHSKETLTMQSGTVKAVSKLASFHGEDVYIKGGTLIANAGDTGIKSKKAAYISGGTLSVTAGDKGVQGKTGVHITGGTLNIAVSRAAGTSFEDFRGIVAGQSGKGVDGSIHISAGNITINSYGDCIRASKDVTISGGVFNLTSTGDDGIQAKGALTMSGSPKLTIKAKGKKVKGEKESIAAGIRY